MNFDAGGAGARRRRRLPSVLKLSFVFPLFISLILGILLFFPLFVGFIWVICSVLPPPLCLEQTIQPKSYVLVLNQRILKEVYGTSSGLSRSTGSEPFSSFTRRSTWSIIITCWCSLSSDIGLRIRDASGYDLSGSVELGQSCSKVVQMVLMFWAWPNTDSNCSSVGPVHSHWPRSVSISNRTDSFSYLSRHKIANCRGLSSNLVLALIQDLDDFDLLAAFPRSTVSPFEPFNYHWLPFDKLQLLLAPTIEMGHYLDLKERVHHSSLVSAASSWFWDSGCRAVVQRMLHGSWSELVSSHTMLYNLLSEPSLLFFRYTRMSGRGRQLSLVSNSLDGLWSIRYLTLVYGVSYEVRMVDRRTRRLGFIFPILNGYFFVGNPRPDWTYSYVSLSMRGWSRIVMVLMPNAADLSLIILLNYSFEKRLQLSSHWERSLSSSSFFKERIFSSSWIPRGGQTALLLLARNHSIFDTAFVSLRDALGLVFVTTLGDKRCFLTSMSYGMTRLYLGGFNTMTLPTRLTYGSNSLSFSFENLSFSLLLVFAVYLSMHRGCLIPSIVCKNQV